MICTPKVCPTFGVHIKLPWSFNCLLIDKVDDIDKRVWYAEKCIENGWSHVVLDHQIDLNLYERQG